MKVVANYKYTVTKNLNNKIVNVVVYADHFQTTVDGSLIFYINGGGGNSIPILAYPHGEWMACNLQSVMDQAVANGVESVLGISQTNRMSSANFSSRTGVNTAQTVEQQEKAKRSVSIESELKVFIQSVNEFDFKEFMRHLKSMNITPSNNELEWAISNAIKAGKVPARKFINSKDSALLDAHMRGAMQRHWDDSKKVFPIFEIMKDKNETRDLDAIVLTAWISISGYLK